MNSKKKKQKIILNDFTNQIITPSQFQKFNKENEDSNDDNNFWDIVEDEKSNNLNLSGYDKYENNNNINNSNNKYNFDIKIKLEKDNIKSIYNKQINPVTPKLNTNIYIKNKCKTMKERERKKNRNNSVEINNPPTLMPKKKIDKIDYLGVFNRNQKWLKNKKDKLNKEIEKVVTKRERDYNESLKQNSFKKPFELEPYNVFNEENSVKNKKENSNYFMRLYKQREEKAKAPFLNDISHKANLFQKSHYSGIHTGNMTTRQMNVYIKYIYDKLKGKK